MQEQGLANTCTLLEFAIVINMGSVDYYWVHVHKFSNIIFSCLSDIWNDKTIKNINLDLKSQVKTMEFLKIFIYYLSGHGMVYWFSGPVDLITYFHVVAMT